jgi:hypothetical protein
VVRSLDIVSFRKRSCDGNLAPVTKEQSVENQVIVFPIGLWQNARMDTSSFGLLYMDRDPRTALPSACLYLKGGGSQDYAGINATKLITAPCLSFVELDSEIRRLHAELDEIRAQAKKKFYKAESAAMAAGA